MVTHPWGAHKFNYEKSQRQTGPPRTMLRLFPNSGVQDWGDVAAQAQGPECRSLKPCKAGYSIM